MKEFDEEIRTLLTQDWRRMLGAMTKIEKCSPQGRPQAEILIGVLADGFVDGILTTVRDPDAVAWLMNEVKAGFARLPTGNVEGNGALLDLFYVAAGKIVHGRDELMELERKVRAGARRVRAINNAAEAGPGPCMQ